VHYVILAANPDEKNRIHDAFPARAGIVNNAALQQAKPLKMEYRNPVPTVDVILERDSKILMVRRKAEPFKGGIALPGGFVNEGETVEEAAKREAMEETSLDIEPIDILGVYSDPERDPRGHSLSVVFIGIIVTGSENAGDDAEGIEWVDLSRIDRKKVAFDHIRMLDDYRAWKASGGTFWSTKRRN
jgi:ADP-ribose pyrophosphatase YjhB (NUDIX family)